MTLVVFEAQLPDSVLIQGCPCFRDFAIRFDNGRNKIEKQWIRVEFLQTNFVQAIYGRVSALLLEERC